MSPPARGLTAAGEWRGRPAPAPRIHHFGSVA